MNQTIDPRIHVDLMGLLVAVPNRNELDRHRRLLIDAAATCRHPLEGKTSRFWHITYLN